MRPVSDSVAIDVPREHAYEFLCDLANRPAFTDHFMREYRLERIEPAGVGAAARFRVRPLGARTWMETVIDEVEPPHRIIERGHCGRWDRIPVNTAWELTEGPGETSEVKLTFWTEPSTHIDRFKQALGARRWYRRRWARALRRLKDALESDRAVERVEVAGAERAVSR
jgi:uncharacterized protein YndB with AHSA1/START domain